MAQVKKDVKATRKSVGGAAPSRKSVGAASKKASPKAANASTKRRSVTGKPGENGLQHTIRTGCLSTSLKGEPCQNKVTTPNVAYCDTCLKNGDPSMSVKKHPKFGKCLVATRDLPAGYRMSLWGDRVLGSTVEDERWQWVFEFGDNSEVIDPPRIESCQVQFCQCPGPDEVVTVSFAKSGPTELVAGKKGSTKYASMVFQTTRPVKKNQQLVMLYAEGQKGTTEFFESFGIKRSNVGCDEWPALRREAGKGKK